MSEAIKVVVRVRPMNTKQKERGCQSIVKSDEEANQIQLTKPDEVNNKKDFAFDHVFDTNSVQQVVYSKTAYGLVQNVLLGYNGTIFAYGQTGCGKTHSMVGNVEVQELQGIIPRSFGHILSSISQTKNKQFLIRCSFIQIYNQQVRDLLSSDVKAKLQIKESPDKGVFIKDLSQNTAKTHDDLMNFMNIGNKNRSVGQTAMNKDSSRSHLLFMLYLQSAELTQNQNEEKKYVASKLNLVDLAGSERLSKTGAAGDRLKEAQKINLSLSALGNVISALVDGKSHHIPYRDSKLTRLLQDSLGGNTKTVMIANCSPADYNYDQTLSTLRYASRAKFIKNKPIINQDPKDALLKEYAEQIKRLKMMIQGNGGQIPMSMPSDHSNDQMNQKLKAKQAELSNQKEEKRKLLEKIRSLQHNHVQSTDIHLNKNIQKAMQRASIINKEDLQHIQQIQKNKPQTLEDQQKKLEKNQNLINTQQIKLKYKSLVKKLKEKVRSLETELKDINHENYMDKQVILQDVRNLNKQNQLLEGIINVMLRPHQLQAIREAATYNQQKQEYRIPPFYLKGKQLQLPKLNDNQSLEMIRQMQQGRRLSWSNSKQQKQVSSNKPLKSNQNVTNMSPSMQKIKQPYGFDQKKKYSVNDIIKDARNDTKGLNSMPQKKQQMRKLQLQPISKQAV